MTSTATQRLRLELQAYLDNPNAWGDRANNVFTLIEQAIAGVEEIAVSGGTVTLSAANYLDDQARNAVLRFVGTGGSVVIPAVEKLYLIDNRCTGTVTVKTVSTTGTAMPSGSFRLVYCDGVIVNAPSPTGTTALGTPFTPFGNLQSTNVQGALQEVDAEKAPLLSPTFTGTVSTPALSVAGRRVYGGQALGASTGGGGNIVQTQAAYLDLTFQALGERIFTMSTGRVQNSGAQCDIVWTVQIIDITAQPNAIVGSVTQTVTAAGPSTGSAQFSLPISLSNATVGSNYIIRIIANKVQATGSPVAYELYTCGVNF